MQSIAMLGSLVDLAYIFGGIAQQLVASQVRAWRWLLIVAGILAVAAGVVTFVWPDVTLYAVSILVAWYVVIFGIVHIVTALTEPKLLVVARLLLGIAELVLGMWAVHSWQRPLWTLVTLVGDVGQSSTGSTDSRRVRGTPGRQAGRTVDRPVAGPVCIA